MKKTLFFLAAAALVASCTSNEKIGDNESGVIGFTKSYVENSTKAINKGAYTTANFETVGNTFGVFGYKTTATQTNAQVFNDKEVEYRDGQTATYYDGATDWVYDGLVYWDKAATKYSFFAYAPHQDDFNGKVSLASGDATTFKIADFKQATSQADMIDLMKDMASQKEVTGANIGSNDVSFTFGHILSNINVVMSITEPLKNDETDNPVSVISVVLGKISMDGDYEYVAASGDYAWTLAATPTQADFAGEQTNGYVFAEKVLTNTEAKSVAKLTDLLFVPQTVVEDYIIKVQYKIAEQIYDAEVKLSDFKDSSNNELPTWVPGYKYTYHIVIGPKPILFDLTGVTDWGNGGTYTYNIE